jgi:hypothetical protein
MLRQWARAKTPQPDARQRKLCARFESWCNLNGVPLPACGRDIGEYLLHLLDAGAPMIEIKQTATAIVLAFEAYRLPLNYADVRAALAICAAQLAPDRVLN